MNKERKCHEKKNLSSSYFFLLLLCLLTRPLKTVAAEAELPSLPSEAEPSSEEGVDSPSETETLAEENMPEGERAEEKLPEESREALSPSSPAEEKQPEALENKKEEKTKPATRKAEEASETAPAEEEPAAEEPSARDPQPEEKLEAGWHRLGDDAHVFYLNEKGEKLRGLHRIGQTTYLFNQEGYREYGWHRLSIGEGKTGDFYFDPHFGGGMVTGKRSIGKTTYLFKHEGYKEYGWHRLSIGEGKTGDFYFDPRFGGGMITGKRSIGKTTYLFKHEGYKEYGWHRLPIGEGKSGDFYFDPRCHGGMISGKQTINLTTYLFNKEGYKEYGWHRLGGNDYYFDARRTGGMATGVYPIQGQTFLFAADGKKLTGLQHMNGNIYYANAKGAALSGWQRADNGYVYYFDPATKAAHRSEWLDKSGGRAYVNRNGIMLTGNQRIGGRDYYFSSSGLLQSHWNVQGGILRIYNSQGKVRRKTYVGSSYILIDLNHHTLHAYKNDGHLLSTPVITGKPSTPTPAGNYKILQKSRNRTLTGPTWSSFVRYWMGLGRGYGIHDASWQASWKYELEHPERRYGSHGCINTPYSKVQTLYHSFSVGTPVIIY